MRVFCVTSGQPASFRYYSSFPHEPVLPSSTVDVTPEDVGGTFTVSTLFDRIVKGSDKDIGLVCHGSDTGLQIPLCQGCATNLTAEVIDLFTSSFNKQVQDDDAAKRLQMQMQDYRNLIAQIQQVRAKRLNRVIFRACIVGKNEDVLNKFRQLFGSASVCAPTSLDVFGAFGTKPYITDEKGWTDFKSKYPNAELSGTKPNRFGLSVTLQGLTVTYHAAAESDGAVKAWAGKKLPPGKVGDTIYVTHFLLGPTDMVFPGDSGYRDNLARVG